MVGADEPPTLSNCPAEFEPAPLTVPML